MIAEATVGAVDASHLLELFGFAHGGRHERGEHGHRRRRSPSRKEARK